MSPRILPVLLLVLFPALARSHGLLVIPNQRGTLDHGNFNQNAPVINRDTERDHWPHFPAGDKCDAKGCGKHSQERAAGPAGWTPFEPLKATFKWRAGVCGDAFGNPEHLKGGKYYNSGQIVATYKQGGKIAMEMNVIAHHNGFIEFHICDVKKCGGEISQSCFRDGHCKQLQRSYNPKCDGGYSKECAPRDPNYPGRWYLPCSKYGLGTGLQTFGKGGTILYDLPDNLVCEHCVLQWFWTSANGCNPPGVRTFFDGPHAPKNWGNCVGQSGAIGGVTRVQKDCGRDEDGEMKFPEEYLQCADIRIEPSAGRSGERPDSDSTEDPNPMPEPVQQEPSVTPSPSPVSATDIAPMEPSSSNDDDDTGGRAGETGANMASGVISDIVIYGDGKPVRSISDGDDIDVSGYDGITIEAVTSREVHKVEFYIDGKFVRKERVRPYFLAGNSKTKVHNWNNPILNRAFTLMIMADGDMKEARITLVDK